MSQKQISIGKYSSGQEKLRASHWKKQQPLLAKRAKWNRIKDWESPDGTEWPSVKQVEKLARLYRRPVDVFYLKYIPKDFPALKDFRKNKDEGLSTALIFMMREIQEKQEWLSKFLAGNREKNRICRKYTIKSPVETVAKDIRKNTQHSAWKSWSKTSQTLDWSGRKQTNLCYSQQ